MPDSHIPERYIVRTTYTRCTSCGDTSAASEFLALSLAHSRNHLGAPVKCYEPTARPLYDLPIEYVAAPPRTTAYCVRCPTPIDLSHLPPAPSAAQLHDIAEPVLRTTPRKPGATAPTRPATPKFNIRDLA